MTKNKVLLPQQIYFSSLRTIDGINFSQREIEVLSCMSQTRTVKKIASFLSISPKTVDSHIRNIRHKLDGNSREGIVDFVESSDKYLIIKSYYSQFLILKVFEKTCGEIAKVFFSNSEESSLKNPLRIGLKQEHSYLSMIIERHLSLVRITNISYVDPSLDDRNSINFSTIFNEQENYYLAIFHLLSKLFPEHNFDGYQTAFEIQCENLLVHDISIQPQVVSSVPEEAVTKKSTRRLSKIVVSAIAAILIISAILCVIFKSEEDSLVARSELPVPADSALLKRSKLLTQIEQKLKEQGGIQRIALVGVVGIGGVGKTTIARQFCRNQQSSIIWEINAETKNTLVNSFKDLAYILAKTENQKDELAFIHNIKNNEEREKQILFFVKNILRKHQNWLLIYDNVEAISEIKIYLPQDPEMWGKGKVIITTRDGNIRNTNYIKPEYVVEMGELSQIEALTLFSKILFNCEPDKLGQTQKEEALNFLQNIPSFPLDIAVSAYYLKETKISYSKYLDYIKKYSEEFLNIQKAFLENIGDYVKTRYGIITLSLQNLINSDSEFKDLLFFISLLDSQNIPKNLLKKYKNEIIVDNFIYSLKKYSLITSESVGNNELIPSISIHRSTQHISFCYLTKPEELEKNSQSLQQISAVLANYISEVGDRKHISEIKILINHGNQFLSHRNILSDQSIGIVGHELGIVYFYMGNFAEASKIFEESFNIFKNNKQEQIRAAKIAIYMGAYYRLHLGELNKAKNLTEYGLKTCENYYEADHPEIAKALMYYALVHRCLGNYKEAKGLLERSLSIYKKNFGQNNVVVAEVMVYLGRINTRLGLYSAARDIIEQASVIFKENLGENHIEVAWTSVYLAEAYSQLGYYQKAVELLEKSKSIYEKHENKTSVATNSISIHLGKVYTSLKKYKEAKELIELGILRLKMRGVDNDFRMTWALTSLGNVFMNLENYAEARQIFEQALKISEQHYGDNHVETANILMHLGQNYCREGNVENGIEFFNKSLRKFQYNLHPDGYKVLEALAEAYFVKSKGLLIKGDVKKSKTFISQSIDHLTKALEIIKAQIPEGSFHKERIQTRLEELCIVRESNAQT